MKIVSIVVLYESDIILNTPCHWIVKNVVKYVMFLFP